MASMAAGEPLPAGGWNCVAMVAWRRAFFVFDKNPVRYRNWRIRLGTAIPPLQ